MKQTIFGIISAFILLATEVSAQGYVRKTVRPNFFVPERELNRRERLPEFPSLENGTIKVTDQGVMVKTQPEVEEYEIAEDFDDSGQPKNRRRKVVKLPFFKVVPMQNSSAEYDEQDEEYDDDDLPDEKIAPLPKPEPVYYKPEDGLGDDLSRDSAYQAKLQAYQNDLRLIAKTGKQPDNPELDNDLKKMNSDSSFRVN